MFFVFIKCVGSDIVVDKKALFLGLYEYIIITMGGCSEGEHIEYYCKYWQDVFNVVRLVEFVK